MQFLSYHACQANSVLLTEGRDAFFTASIIAGEASINKRCTGDIESCGYVAYVCLCVFMCVYVCVESHESHSLAVFLCQRVALDHGGRYTQPGIPLTKPMTTSFLEPVSMAQFL